jgi:two-component system, LytTR family, sensor kinase
MQSNIQGMNNTWKKNGLAILLLLFIGNLIALIIDPSFVSHPKIWLSNCLFSIGIGYPLMKLSELISRKYAAKISWEKSPAKRIAATLGLVIALSVVLTILMNYIFLFRIHGLSFHMFMKTTALLLLLEISIAVYIFTLLTGFEFFRMWKEGLIKQESLQRKALELQLESLKNQINPHFLFNSLNTITTLVHKDPDLAVSMIMQLCDSYRYMLELKDQKAVSWPTEKQFVECYLNVQKMRFANHLLVNIHPHESPEFDVVPLSVQMLVENAIKHNAITADRPLSIEIFTENRFLVVRNNLQVKQGVPKSGLGLENIRQQYRILTNREVEVIQDEAFFTVKLPMIDKTTA